MREIMKTGLHYTELLILGHLDITKYLVSQGDEVNKGDNDSRTAITLCCLQEGHLDITKYLVSQGDEVNKGDNDSKDSYYTLLPSGGSS